LFVAGYINPADEKTLSLCYLKFNIYLVFGNKIYVLLDFRIYKAIFTVKLKQLVNARIGFPLVIYLPLF
jgi:hypothetical protein